MASMQQEPPEEEPFPEEGAFGCVVIYGLLLGLIGLVLIGYGLLGRLPAIMELAPGDEAAVTGGAVIAGLLALLIAAGLWWRRPWAWWLIIILHSLGALLSLLAAALPLLLAGGSGLAALSTPATALMGATVNVVIVAWFWRYREGSELEPLEE